MNPFKWTKDKLASALAKREVIRATGLDKALPINPKPKRPQHPARAQALSAAEAMRQAQKRLERTKAYRRRWRWFHVSKWPVEIKNPKTGEVEVRWAHKTYRRAKAA